MIRHAISPRLAMRTDAITAIPGCDRPALDKAARTVEAWRFARPQAPVRSHEPPGPELVTSMRFKHRNRTALFGWCLIGAWWAIVIAVTGQVLPSGNTKALAVLSIFWVAGFAFAGYILSIPIVSVEIADDGAVTIVRRSLGRSTTTRYGPGALGPPRVREDMNSDGDPYWRCALFAGSERFVIAEGHDRARVEAVAADLAQAMDVRGTT